MDRRNIPWKAEWKAAGLDPGPLTAEEEALVADLKVANREFVERHPRRKKPVSLPRQALWAVPLAAALLVVTLPFRQPAVDQLERVKGAETGLSVYRQGDHGPERLSSGAVVHPGDVLQAAYLVTKPLQGALLSVDGAGNVTVHLAHQGLSVALTPGAERPLASSYELDRAPRFEVFFLVTSETAFEVEPIRQALKTTPWNQLGPGALGAGLDFKVVELAKAATR